jgi:hypothetical protein
MPLMAARRALGFCCLATLVGCSPDSTAPDDEAERVQRLVRSDLDSALRFEIDSVAGLEPYPSSTDYLARFYADVLDKPGGITFELDETLPAQGQESVWTIDSLDAFAREHAGADVDGAVTIHVLMLDGSYEGDGSGTVLGVAWDHRFLALFQDVLRGQCASSLVGALRQDSCEAAERNVWAHEIGHLIGLVDNGLAMQIDHRDPDHGSHDVAEGCLMYWAYEEAALFDTLLARLDMAQRLDIDLCAACRDDLEAARAR